MSGLARAWLEPDEIRAFCRPSTTRGLLSVLWTWCVIAASMAVIWRWPHPALIVAVVVVLGGQQMALAVLMHECAHRTLVRGKRLNLMIGTWLCGAPIGFDVARYRAHHLRHHSHTGTAADPDLILTEPFPTTRRSMLRKVARDLSGIAGLRRLVGVILMGIGALSYTASTEANWLGWPKPSWAWWRATWLRLAPPLWSNALLLAAAFAVGAPWLYGVWALAWLTSFSLIFRLRAIAEHACTEAGNDTFRNTRTVRAGPLARWTVAPHHVNYHIEHHLLMSVPHYRLADLHRLLVRRGALDGAQLAPSYLEVWRSVLRDSN